MTQIMEDFQYKITTTKSVDDRLSWMVYLPHSRKMCVQYSTVHCGRKGKKHSLCKYYIGKADLVLILNDKSRMLFNVNPF